MYDLSHNYGREYLHSMLQVEVRYRSGFKECNLEARKASMQVAHCTHGDIAIASLRLESNGRSSRSSGPKLKKKRKIESGDIHTTIHSTELQLLSMYVECMLDNVPTACFA